MVDAFGDFGVMPEIIQALRDLQWDLPTDIQAEAIPLILGGGDVMAAAETGSGKTGAFAIPILQIVYETIRGSSKLDIKNVVWKFVADEPNKFININQDAVKATHTAQWLGCKTSLGLTSGKYYFEAHPTEGQFFRVGFIAAQGQKPLGLDYKSYGFGSTGKKSNAGQFDDYGEPFGVGDVIGCYLDCDNGTVHFSKNGTIFPTAFTIPKQDIGRLAYCPAVLLKDSAIRVNFGTKPFAFPPQDPSYIAVSKAETKDVASGLVASAQLGRKPLCIIVEPSRELALQTHNAILSFKKHLPPPEIQCAAFIGGGNPKQHIQQLKQGVDIVTGTPGRLQELMEMGQLLVDNVRFLVLDEADHLLDTDSKDFIMQLYNKIPRAKNNLQVLLFSATLHGQEVKALGEAICKFPMVVDLKGQPTIPPTVEHAIVLVNPDEDKSWMKPPYKFETDGMHRKGQRMSPEEEKSLAIKLLKPILLKKLIDTYEMESAFIFVRTKLDADNLGAFFESLNTGAPGVLAKEYSYAVIHSGKPQHERTRGLEAFKRGDVRFVICTDVLARGVDVKELPYMINYTMPQRPNDYVHRIGRVGRADRMGLAISLVGTYPEKVWYHQCPSRGEKCHNTALLENGGCAIWYNEMELVSAVEALVKQPIPRLDKSMRLPTSTTTRYGMKRGEADLEEVFQQHAKFLEPIVAELAALETKAQRRFWQFKARWQK